jgi:pyruvate dehydrogenase E1 component beta subunit
MAEPAAITLIEAITQALAYEMRNDNAVVVLGEDVGVNGGVFRATAGLSATFGTERVLDTPLDETTIAGLTVGMASQGMKPVAEAQFDGFMYPMVDFIVCHAARMRYRTRGRLSCPMVLRVPWGGGIRAPEHHSEANEAIFTNVPGLRVVLPSSPARAPRSCWTAATRPSARTSRCSCIRRPARNTRWRAPSASPVAATRASSCTPTHR